MFMPESAYRTSTAVPDVRVIAPVILYSIKNTSPAFSDIVSVHIVNCEICSFLRIGVVVGR